MEKIDPLFQKKCEYQGQKTDLFFQNRGHADFEKTDLFSLKFRTMMHTREWRDRVTGVQAIEEITSMIILVGYVTIP